MNSFRLDSYMYSEGALIVRPPVGGLDADYMGGGQYGPLRKIP